MKRATSVVFKIHGGLREKEKNRKKAAVQNSFCSVWLCEHEKLLEINRQRLLPLILM